MTFFLFWLVLSILAGIFASKRGRSAVGFFLLALILSPLVAFIWVAVAPGGKECPYCSEKIKRGARVCRFCGREVSGADTKPPRTIPPAREMTPGSAPSLRGRASAARWWLAIGLTLAAIVVLFVIGHYQANRNIRSAISASASCVLPAQFFLKATAERGPEGEVYILGTTNLPDGMKMWVILGRKRVQLNAFVTRGKFRSGPFYQNAPLPVTGRQPLEFTSYFNSAWQNTSVLSLVGENGKNLHGTLFKLTDPDVADSAKILDAKFILRLPPVSPQAYAINDVKHAFLSIPGVGRSKTEVEENIRLFERPGTGIRPGKGWSANLENGRLYNVEYDFTDGTGEKRAIWSVDVSTKQVKYVNMAAKFFSAAPGKVL